MGKSSIFMFVISFWICLWIVFGFVGQALQTPDEYNNIDDSQNIKLTTWKDSVFFIFRVLFWQVPESYGMPQFVYLLLDLVAIASIFVLVQSINPFGGSD